MAISAAQSHPGLPESGMAQRQTNLIQELAPPPTRQTVLLPDPDFRGPIAAVLLCVSSLSLPG